MARDPRKSSAFDSGMRGKEKPKADASATAQPDGASGSESRQAAGKTVGDAGGVDLSAYTSGMRGREKAKQKDAAGAATQQPKAGEAGGNKQQPHSTVGKPGGHSEAGKGDRSGVSAGSARSAAADAYGMGRNDNAANSSEEAAAGHEPSGEGILGEEDDTHINIRIPKSSLKRKQSGMAGTV
jgi:hypothetical protein